MCVLSVLLVVDVRADGACGGREVLVWDSISENLSRVVDTWWENDAVVEKLNAFRRVRLRFLIRRALCLGVRTREVEGD